MSAEKEARSIRRRSPLPVVLIAVLLVIALGAIGFALFYQKIYLSAIRRESVLDQKQELTQSARQLDTMMRSVENVLDDAANNPRIRTFTGHRGDYPLYHEITDQLMILKGQVGRAFSLWAVFPDEDLVLTSNEGYSGLDEFYDNIWTDYEVAVPLNDRGVRVSRAHTISSPAFGAMKVLSFLRKVELYGEEAQGKEAYVVMNVRLGDLISQLGLITWKSVSAGEELMILDRKGQYIYDRTGLQGYIPEETLSKIADTGQEYLSVTIGGQTYVCMEADSEFLPWRLIRISANLGGATPTDFLQRVVIAALVVGLILSVAAVWMVYRRIFLPYQRILRRMNGDNTALQLAEHENEMDYIEGMMVKAVVSQEVLTQRYLENVILYPAEEAPPGEEAVQIGQFLLVVLQEGRRRQGKGLYPEQYGRAAELLTACFESERQVIGYEQMRIVPLPRETAVILEGDQTESARTLPALKRIRERLKEEWGHDCVVSMSSALEGSVSLHLAYMQAWEAWGIYYCHPEEGVVCYEALSRYEQGHYSPNPVVLEMFRNNLQNRQFLQAGEAIGSIEADVKKGIGGRIYTNLGTFIATLFDDLDEAVRRTGQDPGIFFSSAISGSVMINGSLHGGMSSAEAFSSLREMLALLQSAFPEKPQPRKLAGREQIARSAKAYIDENYTRGISLSELAKELAVDESYLSKVFKEQMGCSFVQYVTTLRIARAKELLLDEKKTQETIAEELGMGNAQNFIRTFKKYEGMTPGAYRKSELMKRHLAEN